MHEVENLFLHPPTLGELVSMMGGDPATVAGLLLAAADRRAGSWTFDAARTDRRLRDFADPSKAVRELVHRLQWSDFSDPETRCDEIARLHGDLSDAEIATLKAHLMTHLKIYARKRGDGDLWKICEGKEVFRALIPQLGLVDEDAGERAITAVWERRPDLIPSELAGLRAYIQSL